MKAPCGHIISFINFCRLSRREKKLFLRTFFYLDFDCNEIFEVKINFSLLEVAMTLPFQFNISDFVFSND
jgi:hypothetical protein